MSENPASLDRSDSLFDNDVEDLDNNDVEDLDNEPTPPSLLSGEPTPEPGAPSQYDLKPPEGFESLDENLVEKFTTISRENNLSNEVAQSLVDMYGEQTKQRDDTNTKAYQDQLKEWKTSTEEDEEIGGNNIKATVANAKKAIQVFGNEGFLTILEDSGLANHPEVVRFLSKVGSLTQNDSFEMGLNSVSDNRSAALRIYPTMKA